MYTVWSRLSLRKFILPSLTHSTDRFVFSSMPNRICYSEGVPVLSYLSLENTVLTLPAPARVYTNIHAWTDHDLFSTSGVLEKEILASVLEVPMWYPRWIAGSPSLVTISKVTDPTTVFGNTTWGTLNSYERIRSSCFVQPELLSEN